MRRNLERIQWLAQARLKHMLERKPTLFVEIMKFKYRRSDFLDRIASRGSVVCIEGFYRSANSFAVRCFRSVNDLKEQPPRIATHVHSSAHVRVAIKLRIPTLVLIRPPLETALSTKAWMMQLKKIPNAGDYPMSLILRRYSQFYEDLMSYRSLFVTARFDEVIEDFGNVIEKMNRKFHTNFNRFHHSDANVMEIFNDSKVHLSPSPQRQKIKECISEELVNIKIDESYKLACDVYDRFISP